jgi:hypothetical protein
MPFETQTKLCATCYISELTAQVAQASAAERLFSILSRQAWRITNNTRSTTIAKPV